MKKIIVTSVQEFQTRRDHRTAFQELMMYGPEEMEVSDGYHTFGELYDHRITLYISLCKIFSSHRLESKEIWRSKKHSDGELCFGTGTQFVLGIGKESGKQISYHIPVDRWDETDFAETLEVAPEFDSHTSKDVLVRLKNLI